MKIELTEEQQMLRQTVREFALNEVAPQAAELDRTREFPVETIRKAAEMGLMGVAVAEEWGGAGMDNVSYTLAIEEISRQCASTGVILSVNNSLVCDPIEDWGNDDQKERFLKPLATGEKIGAYCLTEPGSGSDAGALITTAVRDGDDYVVNGTKIFVTNGTHADYFILFVTTDKAGGHKTVLALVAERDTPGLTVVPEGEKLGVRASGTAEVHLEECRIPVGNRLGEEGQGFHVAMRTLDGGRIGIAAQAVGIARGALEEALRYSQERVTFGKKLCEHQAVQFMLADMATEVDAARLLTWKAAWHKDQAGRDLKKRWSLESAVAKLYAAGVANRVADLGLQIHGGYGYTREYPVERHFRDARITGIYEGTSEIQRLIIAAGILKAASA
jgi:butyryl-CoA dehydrogenase